MERKIPVAIMSICIVAALVIVVTNSISNNKNDAGDGVSSPVSVIDSETALSILNQAAAYVSVTENHAPKGTITFAETDAAAELPNIETSFPIVVEPTGKEIVAEIFVSPEKAGTGVDGWLREVAENFNSSTEEFNDKSLGIRVRSITSGAQVDYIQSGVYVPDGFSPSASMWAEMLDFNGVGIELVNEELVGNTAGVLVDKALYKELADQNGGTVDLQTIVQKTEEGTIVAGYTNPFASTTGLNFLASTLYSYDQSNPLSSGAIEGFNKFQNNIPFVAYNTIQMRTAAENNTFSCLVMEYQSYFNNPDLKNNYEFIPYGVRHDNPLYVLAETSSEKKAAIKSFNEFCMRQESQEAAYEYGFNRMSDYRDSIPETDGNTWLQMQKVWKENKNTSKPIAAVFVLDTSGSMSGEPLNSLKESLTNSMKYINSTNYIGVVSYASRVNVDLPIAQFDINQQAYFQGAVSGLNASGSTATYSALSQAAIMLNDFMKTNPNVQPMIFLLSDGEQNVGASFNEIADAMRYSSIPVYTIGYNADLEELKKVSSLNEAASIDADSDDVVYQLKNLFNANL